MMVGQVYQKFAPGVYSVVGSHRLCSVAMSNPDKAAELFKSCNCAQAVLGTLGPAAGLEPDACFRVAAAFGGGMARMGLTCGAVTGGMMVLGLRHGDRSIQQPGPRSAFYAKVQDFSARFTQKHGSIVCRELLHCDLSTPEGQKVFNEQGMHQGICTELVRSAVEILDAMT
ncbi:MAG TPA: C-GCAxxG-C-C family protein [Polyangia bacterium]